MLVQCQPLKEIYCTGWGVAALLLEVKDLYCERDDKVLFENLSFQLQQGQILHLGGSNGSGKTSLLRILCGLYHDFEGQIEYFGQRLADELENYHSSLLYFGHQVSVKLGLTALENLTWYARIPPQLDPSLISKALSEVGLEGYEQVLCQNLSAGQRRRVNLARLYMLKSSAIDNSLWILDEPFTAIDKQGVQELEQHISAFAASGGTVILTTHQQLALSSKIQRLNLDDWGTK